MNATRYGELLRELQPRVIRTETENETTLRQVEELMALGDAITPEQSELLDLLVRLIEDFEEEHYSFRAEDSAGPVDVLRELMAGRGMKQAELTPLLGSKGVVSEILNGKRGISKNQARRLAEHFHVSPALFL